MKTIDTELIGIGTILKNYHLRVPSYQRSYAWEQDSVTDLLDDIGRAIDEREAEYFLGSAVMSEADDGLEIIDGQQRIATLSIVLTATRSWLSSAGDNTRAGIIEDEFLFKKDLATLDLRPKLTLNRIDHPYFLARVLLNGEEMGTGGNNDNDPDPDKFARPFVALFKSSCGLPSPRPTSP